MIVLFEGKENCSGCTACMNVCPTGSITMVRDEEGFVYPVIDHDTCISCGRCQKVCPFKEGYRKKSNYEEPAVYAARHINEKIRMSSTSGGAFTALSDWVLEQGGVCYGAGFDEVFRVCHQKAETKEERDRFKGSKYVQSDLGDIFSDIRQQLQKGRYVLFSATPCHTAGLDSWLKNCDTEKLFLCDIVCHGTPSPRIFGDYVSFLEKHYGKRLKKLLFREKKVSWRGANFSAEFEDGATVINSKPLMVYKGLFYGHFTTRPSCHNCKFSNMNRPSDITIGDFWGIEKTAPHMDDGKGTSLLLINSPKGQFLFDKISKSMTVEQSDVKSCLQPQLQYPAAASPKRAAFWADYHKYGFLYVIKKYCAYGVINGTKRSLKRFVKSILVKLRIYKAF